VTVLDVLPITDGRSREPAPGDDHHWLNDEGRGEVGEELANLLIRAICTQRRPTTGSEEMK
jgi:hypothetical protein